MEAEDLQAGGAEAQSKAKLAGWLRVRHGLAAALDFPCQARL